MSHTSFYTNFKNGPKTGRSGRAGPGIFAHGPGPGRITSGPGQNEKWRAGPPFFRPVSCPGHGQLDTEGQLGAEGQFGTKKRKLGTKIKFLKIFKRVENFR